MPDTLVILAFEASADQATAAVIMSGGRRAMHHHQARHGHAAVITGLAEAALQDCGLEARAITHVAAGCGPGSFTGIRVALSAAKGFQLACDAQPVGLSCLLVAAANWRNVHDEDGLLVASADTRRGSYFCQAFGPDNAPIGAILDIDPQAVAAGETDLPDAWHGARIIGPGAAPLAAVCGGRLVANDDAAPVDAMQIAQLASMMIADEVALPPLQPLYVAPAFLGPPRG
ncbi:MAG: tRNA (adenosine(37)-N6)-threonylcarbamoyltransferase complex dimerization subunit type 1 TsaB [Alphaproteobacteria bacterium]|nr:tRNA (adenosine(37)-N6)-threonylcarbamoyltransferase complex dimerization subunit type 1 TsaB [Alphaproteobacteria bacterium]